MPGLKTYKCELEVRGYELDRYRHVNHAVYVNYFEHARWKLLEEEKITNERFQGWGFWPVVHKIEVEYVTPAFQGDAVSITTAVAELSRVRIVFNQEIIRGKQTVARARVTAVMVNEKGKPGRIPDEMIELWKERNPA
jgi:acyl-CoA thioester hydrolase